MNFNATFYDELSTEFCVLMFFVVNDMMPIVSKKFLTENISLVWIIEIDYIRILSQKESDIKYCSLNI